MSDGEMSIAAASKQAPGCGKCGQAKMQVDKGHGANWECINCGDDSPKTGKTLIITEPDGPQGKLRFQFMPPGVPLPPVAPVQASVPNTNTVPVQGCISINVPMDLFPDLVMWARKLKMPKNWAEATKIKAITDFQVELTNKLGGLK